MDSTARPARRLPWLPLPRARQGGPPLANPVNWLAPQSISFATLQTAGGAFNDYQASFSTGASGGAIGQQLVAVLMSQANPGMNNPIGFDNVRVDVVPEPASIMLLALGSLLALGRARRS